MKLSFGCQLGTRHVGLGSGIVVVDFNEPASYPLGMAPEQQTTVETADAVEGSWVYRQAPEQMRPYLKLARLDALRGTLDAELR